MRPFVAMGFYALVSFVVVFQLFLLASAQEPDLNVYLVNITIFKSMETSIPFTTNHPEVYLSCDGSSHVNLGDVRRTHRLYEYAVGEILAATISKDGCEKCRLRESDPGPVLEDDTFGDWTMCQSDFAETGSFVVDRPGSFIIRLQCPDCMNNDSSPSPPTESVPAPETPLSEEIAVEAAPPSEPLADLDDIVSDLVEPAFIPINGIDSNSSEENGSVTLQSSSKNSAVSTENKSSSKGLSTSAVLSLCFIFLFIGIASGVLFAWKFSKKVHKQQNSILVEALELTKKGFDFKKASSKV